MVSKDSNGKSRKKIMIKLRLNLGCGDALRDDYCNIDMRKTQDGVFIDNIMTLGMFKAQWHNVKVTEICAFHVLEHLPNPIGRKPNAKTALKLWYDLLCEHGKLILELPDFEQTVKEYLAGNEDRIINIYGWNRYDGDVHCWGYTRDSIKKLLEDIGFEVAYIGDGTDYHQQLEPCMRVEAIKK